MVQSSLTRGGVRLAAVAAGVSIAVLAGAATSARAAYFIEYDADPDNDVLTPAPSPLDAAGGSWTAAGGGAGQASVIAEAGTESPTGPAYWQVTDAVSNGSRAYNVSGAAGSTIANALTDPLGWKVSTTLKVIASGNTALGTNPGNYNATTVIDVRNGSRIYDLAFINDGVNEGIYFITGGTTFTNANLIRSMDLDGDYHTFDMVYNPSATEVDLYIDGEATPAFTFTNSNTGTSTVNRVLWGTGSQAASQTVRWQNFSFTSPAPIPEPAMLGFAVAGLAALGLRRRRA